MRNRLLHYATRVLGMLAAFAVILVPMTIAHAYEDYPGGYTKRGTKEFFIHENDVYKRVNVALEALDPSLQKFGHNLYCVNLPLPPADVSKMVQAGDKHYHRNNNATGPWVAEYGLTPEQVSYLDLKYQFAKHRSWNVADAGEVQNAAFTQLIHFNYENTIENFHGMGTVTAEHSLTEFYNGLQLPQVKSDALSARVIQTMHDLVADARANTITSSDTITLGQPVYNGLSATLSVAVNGNHTFPLTVNGDATFSNGQKTINVDHNTKSVTLAFTGAGDATISSQYTVSDPAEPYFWYEPNDHGQTVHHYQDMLEFVPHSHPVNLNVNVQGPKLVSLGVEKSLDYKDATGKTLITDDDANKVSNLAGTVVGLFDTNGHEITWNDTTSVIPSGDKMSSLSYSADGANSTAVYADSNNQPVKTRPASGPVRGFTDAHGKLYFVNLLKSHDYVVKELKAPANTTQAMASVTFNVTTQQPTRTANRLEIYENFNDEASHTTFNNATDKGLVNDLRQFSFNAGKHYTLNNFTFTDADQQSISRDKNPFTSVQFKLLKTDGTPLTWADPQLLLVKKSPSTHITAGTFTSSTGDVTVQLSDQGKLAVNGLLPVGETSYKLQEISTSSRSHIATKPVTLSTDTDNDLVKNNQFFNNSLDYTGVTLDKQGDYLSTTYKSNLGQATFNGAVYGLFYGDGPKANQPVKDTDYAAAAAKALSVSSQDTPWTVDPVSRQITWVGQHDQLHVQLSNMVWGSYYIMELKSGTGYHVDTHKYYFGDKPASLPANSAYDEHHTTTQGANGESVTHFTYTSTDKIRLVGDTLQKREQLIHTPSPFMRSKLPGWGEGTKPVYQFGDVTAEQLVKHQYGSAKLSGNVFALYYAAAPLSGGIAKNTPVKASDPVLEHVNITHGKKVDGFDGFALATDDQGYIGVSNVAYGSYYWKEVQTTPGLAIDPAEYFWGANYTSDPAAQHTSDTHAPQDATQPITQTPAALSQADPASNWLWANTFDHGDHGSTNSVLTFGFSSRKLAFDKHVAQNGENNVTMTLTPINGTQGKPVTTKTFTQYVQDASGKTKAEQGYYEFRTIPYGDYILTSSAGAPERASANLGTIMPILVSMRSTGDTYLSRGYELTFYLDSNKNKTRDPDDTFLAKFTSADTPQIPNQSQINALTEPDTTSSTPETHAWLRPGYKDVNSNGLDNRNFISLEANVDSANFDVNDLPFPPQAPPAVQDLQMHTTATAVDGSKTIQANAGIVLANDKVVITAPDGTAPALANNAQYTLRSRFVQADTAEPVGDYKCTTFVWTGQPSIMVAGIPVNTNELNGKDIVAFEDLYKGNIACDQPITIRPIVRHHDRDDKGQTLRVKHEGVIHTTAYNHADNSKLVDAEPDQQITDTIDLTQAHLLPGHVYTITAQPVIPQSNTTNTPSDQSHAPLPFTSISSAKAVAGRMITDEHDKHGLALPYDSAQIIRENGATDTPTGTVTFNGQPVENMHLEPTQFVYRDGMRSVKILVKGINLSNMTPHTSVVMFEQITGQDINPVIHADITDTSQTVTVKPTLRTKLFNVLANGKQVKEYTPGSKVTFTDIVKAQGVNTGEAYVATLDLMTPTTDKQLDGKDGVLDGMTPYVDANGKPVTSAITITPDNANVTYPVSVSFVTSKNASVIVAYETLTSKQHPGDVVKHHNPKDHDQTVTPKQPPVTPKQPPVTPKQPPVTPKQPPVTPRRPVLSHTGAQIAIITLITLLALSAGSVMLLVRRSHHENM